MTSEQKAGMHRFLESTPIQVEAVDNGQIFDILVRLTAGEKTAFVRIAQYHTNIVHIEKDGQVLLDIPVEESGTACGHEGSAPTEEGLAGRDLLTIADILDFADSCELDDIRPVLDTQIQYKHPDLGGGAAGRLRGQHRFHYAEILRRWTCATGPSPRRPPGSDARMSGCELPVVINSGSGNQGITVSVPVIEYAKALAVPKDRLYRALAVSNLIAIHEKSGIGRLSAYCGAVSAGCAAGCGIAYLQGADYKAIAHTLVNALAIVSGIICDGAKPSCAAKIASSVEAGIMGYHMYLNGQQFRAGDGIVTKGVENTIRNVSQLGREGMRETDKEIVKIMLQDQ